MSAANVMLHPDAGYLYSDAAVYQPNGALARIHSKMHVFSDLCAAVTIRGMQPPDWAIRMLLGVPATLSDLVEALPSFAYKVKRMPPDPGYDESVNEIEVSLVAWWHPTGVPIAYRLTSEDPTKPGYTGPVEAGEGAGPYVLMPASVLSLAPGPASLVGLGKPLASREDVFGLDPSVDGLALMECQRGTQVDMPGIGPIYTVGGFCEMAKVTAEGVEVTLLREWPDQVGELIRPKAA